MSLIPKYHDYTLVGLWFAVGMIWETGKWLQKTQWHINIGQCMGRHPGSCICGIAALVGIKYMLDDNKTARHNYTNAFVNGFTAHAFNNELTTHETLKNNHAADN